MTMVKPTGRAISLAAFVTGRGWLYADEIRGQLARMGFGISAQQVAGSLRRMCNEDAPRFEQQKRWGATEYRLTRYGLNELDNTCPGLHDAIRSARSKLDRGQVVASGRTQQDG